MSAWLVVLVAGAGTYLLRISMLVVAAHSGVPPVIERAARFAVPVAFGALAATSLTALVEANGRSALPSLAAVTAGVAVARRTGSSRAAILTGMPTLWALTAVAGWTP
jgi:branched-subunit amino acid transport protein